MSFSISTTRVLTALLAAGAALAKPIARPQSATPDLGGGIPTASGLTITSISYFGDGCPEGSLKAEFCPDSTSFNVSITDLKAILQDGKPSDDSSCHLEVGFKTEAQIQLNLLQGDFYGSCYLESAGMTALAHSSVSFAGNAGGSNIPWIFRGPVDAKAVYEHNLLEVFASQCSTGGDFLMLVDLVLHVTRGSAAADAVGYIDIDQLTGAISHAYVIKPSPCGQTIEAKPPSSTQQQYGGSYGKEAAEQTKKTGKTSHSSGDYSSTSNNEEEKKKTTSGGGGSGGGYSITSNNNEDEKKKKEEEEKKSSSGGGGSGGGHSSTSNNNEDEQKKKKKEEEEKKSSSGGGVGGGSYSKEDIERKKKGGVCGTKCEYTPCSQEEENNKIAGFSEDEKKAYYESKESYKLSLDLEYNKETKYGYGASSHDEAKKQGEGEKKPEAASNQDYKAPAEGDKKYLKFDQGNKNDYENYILRTRLLSTGGGEYKPEDEKKDKCKRDADGNCY